MNSTNETVREVCAEIDNEHYPTLRDEGGYEYFVGDWARMKADRLLSAHEREMAAVVAERDAEIRRRALLERALKPVMEIKFSSDDIRNLDEIEYRLLLQGVIAKAQRIILEAWDDKNYFWKGENND